MKGVDLMWYDITGNEEGIEYQILDTSNTTHIKVRGLQQLSAVSSSCVADVPSPPGMWQWAVGGCACSVSVVSPASKQGQEQHSPECSLMVLCWFPAQTYETTADADCPQQEEFEIVRCVGHQHIGSRCITLFNAETDEKICQSCPVYGNVTGACFALANGLSCLSFNTGCCCNWLLQHSAVCAARLRLSWVTGAPGDCSAACDA